MRRIRTYALIALLAGSAAGAGATIPVEGRVYLLSAQGQKSGKGKPQHHEFAVEGKIDFQQTAFALHMKGATWENRPEILLNGTRVDFDPVPRRDGLVVRLPWKALQFGDNVLVLEPGASGTLDVADVDIFSLVGTGEEVHFERHFGENLDATKAAPAKHASQNNFDPVHYDLTLSSTLASTSVTGTMRFTGRSKINGLTTVALDFDSNDGAMNITGDVQQHFSGGGWTGIASSHTQDRVVMTLSSPLNVGEEFTVVISYQGVPETGGSFGDAFRRQTHSGTPIIYTFNEPYKARNWFPCLDLPEYKASFELKVTVPAGNTAVSNGTLMGVTNNGATNTFHWSESYPIPTYLVVLTCTNYQYASSVYTGLEGEASMPVGMYHFPEDPLEATSVDATVDIIRFFSEHLGEYAFIDEKYVNSTHLSGSGMEHNTATSMPVSDVQLPSGINGDTTPGRGRRNVHEVSHHWFGNQVTCKTFDHVWLNEGLGTYAEAMYYEELYGRQAYLNYVRGWNSSGISNTAIMVGPGSDTFAGSLVYRKGGYVSHMLRGVVGDENFYEALRLYLATHKYGTVETSDLQAAMETVSGMDLDAFFDQWCFKRNRPTYDFGWTPTFVGEDNALSLTINQTQSGTDIPDVFVMPIPIVITDAQGNSETFTVQNDQRSQSFVVNTGSLVPFSVEFDPEGWVLKNVSTATKASTPFIYAAIGNAGETSASATIYWFNGGGGATPTGYQIIMTPEGGEPFEAASVDGSTTIHTVTGLDRDKTYSVFVRALAVPGQPSDPTNVLAVRASTEGPKLLVVEGYERWPSHTGRAPYHDFAAMHGLAIGAHGYRFDSAANWATSTAFASNYDALAWVLGEESSNTSTFNANEQTLVQTYMQNGGRLFVSGAEIGWDLHRTASSAANKQFYNDYLKASFTNADDSSGVWVGLYGEPGSIFDGISGISIANADGRSYFAQFPDAITTFGGSTTAIRYNASKIAGLQYNGLFGTGTTPGKLVYLAFGFETVEGSDNQREMMGRVLDFFFREPLPEAFLLN